MTSDYLVDTNVVSETAKPRPDPQVLAWLKTRTPILLSSIGVFELARGVERMAGRKRTFLEAWMSALLGGHAKVIDFDEGAALAAAVLEREARRRGRPLPERDLFILATARSRGYRLATRNLPDFRGHGVSLYDPFTDQHAL